MNAVIYCRVSSKEQVSGTSLESQELACREYAVRHNIDILKVFVERGESAKFADRTQLLELLEYCRSRENAVHMLLVWKVDRLARNVGDHFNIKATLKKLGIQVFSVTEPIDANPEGKLMETILAGFAQFDNDLRASRTLQGMRRKIQEGLFPWKPPLGYKTVTQRGTKKTRPDVPDQPLFTLLQRVWREFATGKYTKAEMLRLMTQWGVRTRHGSPMPKQSLDKMFCDPFYAGVIRDPWSGEEHIGQHIPLVSREVFAKVQVVINRRNRSIRHYTMRPEFPMRMFARCQSCEHYVTGSFSRGRSWYYPYYRCAGRLCVDHTNCRAFVIHDEFMEFLHMIVPRRETIQQVLGRVAEMARETASTEQVLRERSARDIERLKGQQQQLIQMKMENLISNEEFMQQKSLLAKRMYEVEGVRPQQLLEETEIARLADDICAPLESLPQTWLDLPPSLKPRFQQLILPHGFVIGRIGTAGMSDSFSTFWQLQLPKTIEVALSGQKTNQILEELQSLALLLRERRDEPLPDSSPGKQFLPC